MGATDKLLIEWRTKKGVYDAPLEDYLRECRAIQEADRYQT
jgi:hypothetical protein